MAKEYKNQVYDKYIAESDILLDILPEFCKKFHKGRQLELTAKTQYDYLCKMKIFLDYLLAYHPHFCEKKLYSITLDDMAILTYEDVQNFIDWLLKQKKHRNSKKNTAKNSYSTAGIYLSCISTYYQYFMSKGLLTNNPVHGVSRNKRRKKNIIYLKENELEYFMNSVKNGAGLSKRELLDFKKKNSMRDECIIRLLITTGIRVSELVGLDIPDVDFTNCILKIQRKGNNEGTVEVPDTTLSYLKKYLEFERKHKTCYDEFQPLFLAYEGKNKGERLGVRSVERLVKKYAKAAGLIDADKITPHKLRSTFAMHSLAANQNIALLKRQMGHEHISSTQIYAEATKEMEKEHRNDLNSLI